MGLTNETISQFNSDSKKAIRSAWAKPLLSYLRTSLNKKLIYLGLPDVGAYDILEWLDHIDEVYAFQCREYPKPSSPDQGREKVLALEKTLRAMERQQLITTFDVFDGYIEEVIVRGYDNSPTIKEFYQQDTIAVYNLDFCSQVTSPIEYVDRAGKLQKTYKFNAIDRLLNFQRGIAFPNKKFIMFLTLHCSYDGQELSNFLRNPQNSDIDVYFNQVRSWAKGRKAPYLVKAFVYDQLTRFFTYNNFLPEFLPTIYYKGDNSHPLLFFTILGTEASASSSLPVPTAKMKDLLNTPLLSVSNNNSFSVDPDLKLRSERQLNDMANSLIAFKATKTFKNIWK